MTSGRVLWLDVTTTTGKWVRIINVHQAGSGNKKVQKAVLFSEESQDERDSSELDDKDGRERELMCKQGSTGLITKEQQLKKREQEIERRESMLLSTEGDLRKHRKQLEQRERERERETDRERERDSKQLEQRERERARERERERKRETASSWSRESERESERETERE
jgi:hypothetical protein